MTIAADGTYTYDPRAAAALQALNTGASVADSFTYTANDGSLASNVATVSIDVASVPEIDHYIGTLDASGTTGSPPRIFSTSPTAAGRTG